MHCWKYRSVVEIRLSQMLHQTVAERELAYLQGSTCYSPLQDIANAIGTHEHMIHVNHPGYASVQDIVFKRYHIHSRTIDTVYHWYFQPQDIASNDFASQRVCCPYRSLVTKCATLPLVYVNFEISLLWATAWHIHQWHFWALSSTAVRILLE